MHDRVGAQGREGDPPAVFRAGHGLPANRLVKDELLDLGIPFELAAVNIDGPVRAVAIPPNLLNDICKLRQALHIQPGAKNVLHRRRDLDALLQAHHPPPPSSPHIIQGQQHTYRAAAAGNRPDCKPLPEMISPRHSTLPGVVLLSCYRWTPLQAWNVLMRPLV